MVCLFIKAYSSYCHINRTGSSQGFSLVQTLHKPNNYTSYTAGTPNSVRLAVSDILCNFADFSSVGFSAINVNGFKKIKVVPK